MNEMILFYVPQSPTNFCILLLYFASVAYHQGEHSHELAVANGNNFLKGLHCNLTTSGYFFLFYFIRKTSYCGKFQTHT